MNWTDIDALRALPKPRGMLRLAKPVIAVWTMLVAALPNKLGDKLVLSHFVPAKRPQVLRNTLHRFGVIR